MSINPKSEKTQQALKVIRDRNIESPRQFARLMWPDSDGWHVGVRSGGGTVRGRQMFTAGGAYLARLVKAGLVYVVHRSGSRRWVLTKQGKEALVASEDKNETT